MNMLFKANTLDNNTTIIGYGVVIYKEFNEACIIHKQGNNVSQNTSVDPNSISRYLGIADSDEALIFENDLREIYDWGGEHKLLGIAKVVWDSDELAWGLEPNLGIEDRYDLRKALIRSKLIEK